MDYYKTLGVSRTASDAEIKKAYYTLALRYHPDKSTDPESTRRFQDISRAYQVLSEGGLRDRYDRTGSVPDRFQDASASFRQFVNEIMSRWKVDGEVAGIVNETMDGINTGDGFAEMICQLDRNRLFKSGLGIAQKYLASKKADIQSQLRKERIERLPVRSFTHHIDMDNIGDIIVVDVDIARAIEFSHIELIFSKSGETDKRLVHFIEFDTELNIRIWERELTLSFEIVELDILTPVREYDLLLRDRVNPCQLNQPFEWSWEYGSIIANELLCLSETMIIKLIGRGLPNWLEGRRGDLWVCFKVDITAPIRPVLDRMDDDMSTSICDMSFQSIIQNQSNNPTK